LGFTTLGLGAGNGPKPLWRWVIRTQAGLSLPLYSPISLVDCYYTTVDGVKHPVDIVDGGHYGTPPEQYTMSYMGSLLPPGDPITSHWHELYPTYSHEWDLTSWVDNGDGDLTASDQIDMIQTLGDEVGWKYWFHVDEVTVTIHWTYKAPDSGEGAAEPPELTEPPEPWDTHPIGSTWHMVYPDYSREFRITSWEDNDQDGKFNPSDQFDFEFFDEPGVIHWAHLDEITTDIILSFKDKEPPAPEFPLGAAVEVGLIVAVAYIWWTRRRRLKEVL
jgi:hypothetical protein